MNGRQRKREELKQRWILIDQKYGKTPKDGRRVIARVRCQQQLHNIGFHNGKFYLGHHPKEVWEDDLAMSALAGANKLPRCYRVLIAFKDLLKTARYSQDSMPTPEYSNTRKSFHRELSNLSARSLAKTLCALKFNGRTRYTPPFTSRLILWDEMTKKYFKEAFLNAHAIWPWNMTQDDRAGCIEHIHTSIEDKSINNWVYGAFSGQYQIRIGIAAKHWLVHVYKNNIQLLDGYPVVQVFAKSDDCLVCGVIRNVSSEPKLAKAIFHKPTGRRDWWKPWQVADNGQVWRLKQWME